MIGALINPFHNFGTLLSHLLMFLQIMTLSWEQSDQAYLLTYFTCEVYSSMKAFEKRAQLKKKTKT